MTKNAIFFSSSKPSTWGSRVLYIYDGVYNTPGAVFHARLLDSQEGANTERYVFGKLSARRFQRRTVWCRHRSNCGNVEDRKSTQGGVVCYTPSYTVGRFLFFFLVYSGEGWGCLGGRMPWRATRMTHATAGLGGSTEPF